MPDSHTVIGKCYVHGLMDGEALLGPVPHPWVVQQLNVEDYYQPQYLNTITNTVSSQDPRLGTLPWEWRRADRERTIETPLHYAYFDNILTGEWINSDPRLLPEALEQRGIKLETIQLV